MSIIAPLIIAAQLSCDSLQYIAQNGSKMVKLAGVCENFHSFNHSQIYQCAPDGTMYFSSYESVNCTGVPWTIPVEGLLEIQGDVSNVSINCCTGKQCDYVLETIQKVSSCNDSINDITIDWTSETVYPMQTCFNIGINQYVSQCQNGAYNYSYFTETDINCQATPAWFTQQNNECTSRGDGWYQKTSVICATAEKQCESNIIPTSVPFEPTLTCNGLQVASPVGNQIETYLAGICMDGSKYQCSYDATDIYMLEYNNNNCSGNPTQNVSTMNQLSLLRITDYVLNCCEDPCNSSEPQNVDPLVCRIVTETSNPKSTSTSTSTSSSTTENVSMHVDALFNILFMVFILLLAL